MTYHLGKCAIGKIYVKGPKGDRGMLSSVTGDLPTAILEGPPGPPGPKGKYTRGTT